MPSPDLPHTSHWSAVTQTHRFSIQLGEGMAQGNTLGQILGFSDNALPAHLSVSTPASSPVVWCWAEQLLGSADHWLNPAA